MTLFYRTYTKERRFASLFFCFFAVVLTSSAQQNLFNIPAGDLTPKGTFFFQHQTNFYSLYSTESKNHFVWGLGSGWEIGANVLNLKADWRHIDWWNQSDGQNGYYNQHRFLTTNNADPAAPMKPLFQVTAQKFFFLSEKIKTTIGTQVGTNPFSYGTDPRLSHFTYNTWVYEPRHHVKFVVGPYVTDRGTVGEGNNIGVLVGFEYPLHKRLLLMGDFISGNNATAVSVLGFNFLATKRIQLCLGALVPNPRSGNQSGAVFELNILGFDDE
jgi:hypothetical protein